MPATAKTIHIGTDDGRELVFGQTGLPIPPALQIAADAAIPALPPVIVVTPPPPPVPVPGTNDITVPSGGDWIGAIKDAKPGQAVLLQRGGTFSGRLGPNVSLTGKRLGAYGSGLRPVIRVPSGIAIETTATDFQIEALHLMSDAPTDHGMRLRSVQRARIINCYVEGFTTGIAGLPDGAKRLTDVLVQACVIARNWSPDPNKNAQGIFFGATDGLSIIGNLLDSNGWGEGKSKGTDRNHNMYLRGDCGPATVTNNISNAPSSHGMQCRSGGNINGNLLIDCPIGMSYGLVNGEGPLHDGGVSGSVSGNLFFGSRLLADKPRGWALELANILAATVTDNLFAHGTPGPTIKADICAMDDPSKWRFAGIRDLKFSGNRIWDWGAAPYWMNPAIKAGPPGNKSFGSIATQANWRPDKAPNVRQFALDALDKARRGDGAIATLAAQAIDMARKAMA